MYSLIMFIVLTIAIGVVWSLRNVIKEKFDPKKALKEKIQIIQDRIDEVNAKGAEYLSEKGVSQVGELDSYYVREYTEMLKPANTYAKQLNALKSGSSEGSGKERLIQGLLSYCHIGIVALLSVIWIQMFISLNSVDVPDGEIKHFSRVLGGEDLPAGHYVATEAMTANPFGGMKGPQPDIFTPGFHWFWLIDVLYTEMDEIKLNNITIDLKHPHSIPEHHFAIVSTRDGRPMPDSMILAPKWEDTNEFLNAAKFLTKEDVEGNRLGYRGDQFTIITGGTVMANKILYKFENHPNEEIKTGERGVVRSAVNELSDEYCLANRKLIKTLTGGITYLVPKDCAGVWQEDLPPRTYRFHPKAMTLTHMPNRALDYNRHGGYRKNSVSFKMDDNGKIINNIGSDPVSKPESAQGEAIDIVVQGWNVEANLLTKYQIIDAPLVVATIGDFNRKGGRTNAVERFLANPIESSFRIAAQGKDVLRCAVYEEDTLVEEEVLVKGKTKRVEVLHKAHTYKDKACVEDSRNLFDLINERVAIEKESTERLSSMVNGYGIAISMQTMGHPNLPVESLIPRKRANYARQLQATFKEEKLTFEERKLSEAARVEADNQSIVVTQQLKSEAADSEAERILTLAGADAAAEKLRGEGMRDRDIEAAKGQNALLEVMGKDLVQEQTLYRMTLETIEKCPECVKVPVFNVEGGSGSDATSAAAVLGGATNFSAILNQISNGTIKR